MKCLEKDRNRRYETANSLARDIERYLQNEPVQACPPSAWYRLRKFVSRYKRSVLAAGLVLLALVGGIIGTTLGLLEAWRQRDAAEAAADRAAKAQVRAEQGFAKAKEAVEKYLKAVTEDPDLKEKHDLNALRKKLLEAAVPFYLWFVEQKPEESDWEAERGRAYGRLADVRDEMGEKEAALQDYERMTSIFTKLSAQAPTVAEYRRELAVSHFWVGVLLANLGQRTPAQQAYGRALEIQERLVADFPGVTRYRQNLAVSYGQLGNLLNELGQRPEAEKAYRRDLQFLEALVAELPTDPDCRYDLANGYNNLGTLLHGWGQKTAAEQAYRRAIELKEKLAADYPAVTKYRHDLAMSHYNLGNLLRDSEQWSAAEAAHGRALSLRAKLAAGFPSIPTYRQNLAASHNGLGTLFMYKRQWPAAQEALGQAMDIREKLAADFPAVPDYRLDLAASYVNVGMLHRDQGELEASLAWFAKAIALLEPLLEKEPRSIKERLHLRNAHCNRGKALEMLGRHSDAIKDWDRALALNTETVFGAGLRRCRANSLLGKGELAEAEADCREAIRLQPDRAEHHQAVGDVCARSGRWDQAVEAIGKAVELDSGNDWYWSQLAVLQIRTGDVAAYRRTCRGIAERFRDTSQPEIAARTALTLLLLPDTIADTDPVWALADRAVTGTEMHVRYRYFMLVKALAEHRAGRRAEAVKRLEHVAPYANGGNLDAIAFAVLAMAKHHLGQGDDARAAFASAQKIVAATQPDPAQGRPFAKDWDNWLRCDLLLHEAETLDKKENSNQESAVRLPASGF
jgi:tetratricopeptide (TPR) repeat protein